LRNVNYKVSDNVMLGRRGEGRKGDNDEGDLLLSFRLRFLKGPESLLGLSDFRSFTSLTNTLIRDSLIGIRNSTK
jgi:hypothetical protein